VDNLLLGRRFVDDDFAVLQVDRHGEIIRLLLLLVVRVFRRKGSETCQRGPVKGKMVRITNSWLRRDIVTFPNIDLLWRRTGEDDHPGFPTSFFRSDNEKATNHAIHTGTVLFLHVESHDVAILIRLSRSRICLRRVRPATSLTTRSLAQFKVFLTKSSSTYDYHFRPRARPNAKTGSLPRKRCERVVSTDTDTSRLNSTTISEKLA